MVEIKFEETESNKNSDNPLEGVPINNQLKGIHGNSKNREIGKLIRHRRELMQKLKTAPLNGINTAGIDKIKQKIRRKQRQIRKSVRKSSDTYWSEVAEHLEEAYTSKDMKLYDKLIKEAHGTQIANTTKGRKSLIGLQKRKKGGTAKKHFTELLNQPGTMGVDIEGCLPTQAVANIKIRTGSSSDDAKELLESSKKVISSSKEVSKSGKASASSMPTTMNYNVGMSSSLGVVKQTEYYNSMPQSYYDNAVYSSSQQSTGGYGYPPLYPHQHHHQYDGVIMQQPQHRQLQPIPQQRQQEQNQQQLPMQYIQQQQQQLRGGLPMQMQGLPPQSSSMYRQQNTQQLHHGYPGLQQEMHMQQQQILQQSMYLSRK
jgi:hypothetical protein